MSDDSSPLSPRGFNDFDEQLFRVLCSDLDKVAVRKVTSMLKSVGLLATDPRLKDFTERLQQAAQDSDDYKGKDVYLDQSTFRACITPNIMLIRRAFTGELVIPHFQAFIKEVDAIYLTCKDNAEGQVASYIPQLARVNPDYWGASLCTTDGQRYSKGDVNIPFSMQSTSKPISYALLLSELGEEEVHKYIGREPSGESFNNIKLGHDNKPHNPLINAGSIVCSSLMKRNMHAADRFESVMNEFRRVAGGERLGFSNSVFLSEKSSADRNYAIAYYLKENKCFPEGTNLHDTLDFYFQLCSIEITCESGAVIAATLANGGICPLTGEQVLEPTAVRNTLSLMHSCGMYDYSGEFAFKVGLPAKSGVCGAILLVVPNIVGFCLWSPPLDRCGNSMRAMQFCTELVRRFNFHHYDSLKNPNTKLDPRLSVMEAGSRHLVQIMFSAFNGDVTALTRMALSSGNLSVADYDGRTALHIASSEGHLNCVRFLLDKCHVPIDPKDRWGHTPLDDAVRFGQQNVVQYLQTLGNQETADVTDET